MNPEDKLLQYHGYERCPFFRRKGRKITKSDPDWLMTEIFCEGVIPDTGIVHRFENKVDRDNHLQIFCRDLFGCCEYYRSLMAIKYGEDDDGE